MAARLLHVRAWSAFLFLCFVGCGQQYAERDAIFGRWKFTPGGDAPRSVDLLGRGTAELTDFELSFADSSKVSAKSAGGTWEGEFTFRSTPSQNLPHSYVAFTSPPDPNVIPMHEFYVRKTGDKLLIGLLTGDIVINFDSETGKSKMKDPEICWLTLSPID